MRRVLLSVVAGILLAASAAFAHHSYAATYDTSKEIKLEGKLVQFTYRNPHSFVTIQAPDESGTLAFQPTVAGPPRQFQFAARLTF